MLIKSSVLFFIISFYLNCNEINARRQIPIGGLFHENGNDYETEIAFRNSIINENKYTKYFEIIPIIKRIDPLNSFQAERIACGFASEGVVAIFGPNSIFSSGIVASICNEIGIPHIITNWVPERLYSSGLHNFTRNFYPDSALYSRALAEIIHDYDWTEFTLIYDDENSLMRLEDVLQMHKPGDKPVTVRQLGPGPDYKVLLKEIEKSGAYRIVLDCNVNVLMNVLQQAVDVKIMEEYHSYIITSIDVHTIDLSELQNVISSNITTVRMMSSTSFEVTNAVHEWRQSQIRRNDSYYIYPERIKTETALIHDAVHVFASAIEDPMSAVDLEPKPLKCYSSNRWEQGLQILQSMNKSYQGMTGPIEFDNKGRRSNFYLEILEFAKEGFKKIGQWDKENGVKTTRPPSEVTTQILDTLKNKTVVVISRLGMPFLGERERKEGEYLEGNDRFKGYSLDLIDSIAKVIGFKYRFDIVEGNKHGSYNKETKTWNGLVKTLLDRKADLAICDLTITYDRRTAVDFTMPFMTLGISILFAKPRKEPPGVFSFTSPLSLDVWLYMATAYLLVSIILYALARMASDDWENPHPCDDNPEELESIWNMKNCTWLTAGSIMQQGCDLLPKAISTRLVVGSWWFFALIVISSYTANLAAFLTMERMEASITGVEDLAKQNKIKYGALKGGSTIAFFRDSSLPLYQRMYATMESAEPSVFTNNNEEGAERVAKSDHKYAFFMESSSIEYIVNSNCNLTQVGSPLDSKGYGIAMPVNSPYRTTISQAVLKLQEDGKLQRLKQRWWKELNTIQPGHCDDEKSSSSDGNDELAMANVGGVFLVLIVGCGAGFVVGIIEFLWNIRKVAINEKITPWVAFKRELIFSLDIRTRTKPIIIIQNNDANSIKSNKSYLSNVDNKKRNDIAKETNVDN